ncbi:unnamed protein product, partial [Meganyctiphanes norvegica]
NSGHCSVVSMTNQSTFRRYSLLMHTAGQVYFHVKSNSVATIRDVYYEWKKNYIRQCSLEQSVEDLSRLFGVPRAALHLTTTAKGLIAGEVRFTLCDGTLLDIAQAPNGVLVPEGVEGIQAVESSARYILVIEKDATFQKLVEAAFHRTYGPTILITGKGYPDLMTRQLLVRLWRDLRIPVLALMDPDPYGIHIACVYKFGSRKRNEEGLTVPSLALLGVLPTDLTSLALPPSTLLPLEPRDYGLLATLAAHKDIAEHPQWLEQIKEQQKCGMKAEIQNLVHIRPDYLTAEYLPAKIRQGAWLE